MTNSAEIRSYLDQSARVLSAVPEVCGEAIARAVETLAAAYRNGGQVLLCGNGGSAADCQHLAAELVGRFSLRLERRALPALALSTDTSVLTAIANDSGFERVFARQVEAHGRPGDVLLAISTSGRSLNVLAAARVAAARGLRVIALTGANGLPGAQPDVLIAVPATDTQLVQQAHLAVEHLLCALVEQELFGNGAPAA